MSRIQELIKEKCPNGVPYKEIQELCVVTRGRVISKNELRENEGDYPVYSSQTLNNGVFGKINSYDFDGEFVQWTTDGANAGSIFYRNGKFSVTNVCGLLKVKKEYKGIMNTNFLNYILGSISKNYVNYATSNPKLMSNVMAKIKVAVPPIEVQEEIVRILDKFGELETELEAELETELEARKSQYEFWRGKLLNMDYQKIKLLNLCDRVNNINWKNDNNNYKYIDLSSVNRENNQVVETSNISKENAPSRARQIVKAKDVLFGTTRPMLKRITLISQEYDNQICSTGYCVLRPNREKVVPEWLYFNLQTEDFYKYVENFQQGASYPSISDNAVKNYEISLPPIDVQIKVINVLTKLDKLTNDISEGLPTEIELRRKQYEYYRNKLLNFEELKNE
ncbi:MAG TPA: restriction endonuclease subunit S [Candidatus Coprovivens excrementavium]|nr:restriction endonuclease subunit S [Candidatus Coprovivens excrementavium]